MSTVRLPTQLTPFIGRAHELTEIGSLLSQLNCRLLTVVGPGGIGKTRLSLQAAKEQVANFRHGIYFVPLQPVNSVDFMISAMADTLGFPLTGQDDLTKQLCRYLQAKEILLLLDNFEQLLPVKGELILADILRIAPHVKLLVTSREALNLQEEWQYPVTGLALPERSKEKLNAESVQLFNERAQRVQTKFSLTNELNDVVHICQLVEGVPLALELSASWTKMLTCRQIVEELGKNLDLLVSSRSDVPERQQSMRVIFDHTWQHLNKQERDVFKKLSIFRGGFSREAAEHVAGATLHLLANLQAKSLIRWDSHGRYHIHELLRQYAAEKLALDSEECRHIQEAHCQYFATYLKELESALMDSRQLQATQEIEAELENIRVAWQWAVANIKVEAIDLAAYSLGNFYQFQSRYAEGLQAFEQATQELLMLPATKERDLALIKTLMVCSWYYLRFGRVADITAVMTQNQTLHRQLNIDPGPGYVTDPDIVLAFADLIQGDFEAAAQKAEQVCQTSERLNQPGNREYALFLLGQAAMAQGQYDIAQDYTQEAFAISLAMDDRWFRAYILNTLADLAVIKQAFPTAQRYYQTSYDLRREFNDAEGMALALNHLSDIALRQEDYAATQDYYAQSLQLYQEIDDTGGLATTYAGLAYTALVQSDYETARQYYYQALKLAAEIWYIAALLNLLLGIGEILCRIGQAQKGLIFFVMVQQHSAANQEMKNRAAYLINSFKLQVKPEALADADKMGQTLTLESVVESLLVELPLVELSKSDGDETAVLETDPNQLLVEPLTTRELEVLNLLAEGLSNQDIADRLVLAEGTVKYYTRQIYGKLQVRNRVQAVAVAQELNLV